MCIISTIMSIKSVYFLTIFTGRGLAELHGNNQSLFMLITVINQCSAGPHAVSKRNYYT